VPGRRGFPAKILAGDYTTSPIKSMKDGYFLLKLTAFKNTKIILILEGIQDLSSKKRDVISNLLFQKYHNFVF